MSGYQTVKRGGVISTISGNAQAAAAPAAKPAIVSVSIDAIRHDVDLQMRAAGLNKQTVLDYAERLRDGDDPPPVLLFSDAGGSYFVGDGFHRIAAAQAAGLFDVPAIVQPGGRRAALLCAIGANSDHGLPRTIEDKRRAVLALLGDPEWAGWSQSEIAKRARVSREFVAKVVAERAGAGFVSPVAAGDQVQPAADPAADTMAPAKPGVVSYVDKYGHVRQMDTTKIGRNRQNGRPAGTKSGADLINSKLAGAGSLGGAAGSGAAKPAGKCRVCGKWVYSSELIDGCGPKCAAKLQRALAIADARADAQESEDPDYELIGGVAVAGLPDDDPAPAWVVGVRQALTAAIDAIAIYQAESGDRHRAASARSAISEILAILETED